MCLSCLPVYNTRTCMFVVSIITLSHSLSPLPSFYIIMCIHTCTLYPQSVDRETIHLPADSVDGRGCKLPTVAAVVAAVGGGTAAAAVAVGGGNNFGGCGFHLVEDDRKMRM